MRTILLLIFFVTNVQCNWKCIEITEEKHVHCTHIYNTQAKIAVILYGEDNEAEIKFHCRNNPFNLTAHDVRNLSKHFPKVKRLAIQSCRFENTQFFTILQNFTQFNHLEMLDLIDVGQFDLKSRQTSFFHSLTHLFITKTNLLLDSNSFHDLTHLKLLVLSENNLQRLPDKIFANLAQVEEIQVSNNNLSTLNDNLFENCSNLQTVNLSKNNLSVISPDLFKFNRRLWVVYLNSNKIRTFHTENLKSVRRLILSDNQLSCNCSNYDLLRHVNDKRKRRRLRIETENVYCVFSQLELKIVRFQNFRTENLICSSDNN